MSHRLVPVGDKLVLIIDREARQSLTENALSFADVHPVNPRYYDLGGSAHQNELIEIRTSAGGDSHE